MNILRWKRKSKKKIKFKTLMLFIFSLIMTTFAWFAYSKVLNSSLDIHVASWDMQYFIGAEEKTNPIGIGIPTLYPTMSEYTVTIDIKNNGERLVDIEYNVQSITIAGISYEIIGENETNTTGNYIVLSSAILETDGTTGKKIYKGVITGDMEQFPFRVEVEHSAQVEAGGSGYLTVTVNWIGDNNELDSEWGYKVGDYLIANPSATSVMSIVLSMDSYQAEGLITETIVTLPNTEETKPYLPTGFSRVPGTNLSTGLAIKDDSGNEYIWVEVPKTTTVYQNAGLNITEFTETECRTIESDLQAYAGIYRTGTAYSDIWYSYRAVGIAEEDYPILKNKMLKSVYENGGFYIGRYETGIEGSYRTTGSAATPTETPVIKENAYPFNFITCSQAQDVASRMKSGEYTSGLMFGLQWDLVLRYIQDKGTESNNLNRDSTSLGNYKDNLYYIAKSSAKYNSSSWTPAPYDKSQESELLLTTGASSVFYKNNIADIAGNLAEWTLEYTNDSSKPCVYRGGENSKNGVETPANNRGGYGISGSSKNIGFRVTIF